MRLLFFPGGTWVWGQELVTLSLMKALRADGHDCRAVISGWNDGHYERLLTEAGVVHHAVKLGRVYISRPAWTLDTLANLSAAAAQVRRIVRDFKPDAVVISALDQATLLSVCLPREIPLVLHAHSTPDRIYRTLLGKLLLRRVACIVAISRFVETELRCSSAQLRNIATVHNGVEVDGAEVPERSRPSGALRIGIVGQILPRKRHGTLIEAAEKMRRAGAAAFEIHVYGDDSGDLAGRLKALVASKGLSDIFRWHGFVSSHREMFGSLDVVVAPSVDEPFGLTVLEAGRFGLPVVAARSGAFPEIVEHDQTGLLFEPGDADAMAAALMQLTNGRLRRRLGQAAAAHVRANFSIEKMAREFVAAAVKPFLGVKGPIVRSPLDPSPSRSAA